MAGHTGDVDGARAGLDSDDPAVRAAALGALERLGVLDDGADHGVARRHRPDRSSASRRRSPRRHRDVDLLGALSDRDASVVEVAAWACGEREIVERRGPRPARSTWRPTRRPTPSCGSRASPRSARSATTAASTRSSPPPTDKPAIRRRAVLALAPFLDPDHPRAADVDGRAPAGAHRPRLAGPPSRRGPRPDGRLTTDRPRGLTERSSRVRTVARRAEVSQSL